MDWLFEIPWYIPTSVVAAGLFIWFWGNNRLRSREKRIGIALALVAIALALLSYLVDTPREIVLANTRQFVHAVVARDRAAIGSQLDADAIAFFWTKPQIIDGALHYADQTGLTSAHLFSLDARPQGPEFLTTFTVWSRHSGKSDFPISELNSQWQLDWVKVGDRWLIRNIIPLQIGQTPRDEIERRYLTTPVK